MNQHYHANQNHQPCQQVGLTLPGAVHGLSKPLSTTVLMLLVVTVITGLLGGCDSTGSAESTESAGRWAIGDIHRDDIKTVCVEMFETESFRRGAEFDLTHAVCEQLELNTPYKIVSDRRRADTVLWGTIKAAREYSLGQQRELSRPIENRVVVVVEVSWKDLRNGRLLLDHERVRMSADYSALTGTGVRSATLEAVNELAVRVVQAMEAPW